MAARFLFVNQSHRRVFKRGQSAITMNEIGKVTAKLFVQEADFTRLANLLSFTGEPNH